MWECPKCGRTFKRTNQDHYCGLAPATIEEYIERQPDEAQPYLRQINSVLKAALPDVVEKISWSMPTYWKKTESDSVCCLQKAYRTVSRF